MSVFWWLNLAFDAIGAIFYGLSLKILWAWFVVPFFHLPVLTLPNAIGLILVAGAIRPSWPVPVPDEWDEFLWYRIKTLIMSLVQTLGIGWIVHLFI